MPDKTQIKYLVDLAQIASPIATAFTGMVAIWLGLRPERLRPKFFVGWNVTMYGSSRDDALTLTVVNAGYRPIQINGAVMIFPQRGKPDTQMAVSPPGKYPCRLEHGQEVILNSMRIDPRGQPWGCLRPLWWVWNRPKFRVMTSVGKVYYVKPRPSFLRKLELQVLKTEQAQAVSDRV